MSISDIEIQVDAELVDNVYDLGLEGDELLDVEVSETIGSRGGGGGGVTDYTYLSNKPQIEGITLTGNKTLKQFGIIDLIYPVGIYVESSDALFNPNTAWGGTWVLESEGLVHIGAGANYTAGSTGGSADAIVPYHTHTQAAHVHYAVSGWTFSLYKGTRSSEDVGNISGSGWTMTQVSSGGSWSGSTSMQSATPTINPVGTDGNVVGANMQPYIAVYRWHRTA